MLSKLPLLHFDGNYPEGRWHSHWDMDPMVLALCFVLIAGYLAVIGPINERYPGHEERTVSRKQIWCWIGGVASMVVVLGPPFHDWADYFLLSVHMAQHLVLMLLTAPLLLLGLPGWIFDPLAKRPRLDRVLAFLLKPVPAFLISTIIMVIWHIPAMYNMALEEQVVHGIQHQAFLISGIFTWWVIISPNPHWPKASPFVVALYVGAQSIPGAAVGAIITFADPGVYSFYNDAPRLWDVPLSADQELAGILMWVLVPMVYLGMLTVVFLRYAAREQSKDMATLARRPEISSSVPSTPASNSGS